MIICAGIDKAIISEELSYWSYFNFIIFMNGAICHAAEMHSCEKEFDIFDILMYVARQPTHRNSLLCIATRSGADHSMLNLLFLKFLWKKIS